MLSKIYGTGRSVAGPCCWRMSSIAWDWTKKMACNWIFSERSTSSRSSTIFSLTLIVTEYYEQMKEISTTYINYMCKDICLRVHKAGKLSKWDLGSKRSQIIPTDIFGQGHQDQGLWEHTKVYIIEYKPGSIIVNVPSQNESGNGTSIPKGSRISMNPMW